MKYLIALYTSVNLMIFGSYRTSSACALAIFCGCTARFVSFRAINQKTSFLKMLLNLFCRKMSREEDRKVELRKKIEYQVACEERAFRIVERLIENHITEQQLLDAVCTNKNIKMSSFKCSETIRKKKVLFPIINALK